MNVYDPREPANVRAELGPTAPSRAELYSLARECRELLQIATEITLPGPRIDVDRARRLIAEVHAKLGGISPP